MHAFPLVSFICMTLKINTVGTLLHIVLPRIWRFNFRWPAAIQNTRFAQVWKSLMVHIILIAAPAGTSWLSSIRLSAARGFGFSFRVVRSECLFLDFIYKINFHSTCVRLPNGACRHARVERKMHEPMHVNTVHMFQYLHAYKVASRALVMRLFCCPSSPI